MQTTENLLNVFENFRMTPTAIDRYHTGGRDHLAERITSFVKRSQPIEFYMLGFPFKSVNQRDKVIGTLPDRAEVAAAENFSNFAHIMKASYPPGIRITILSDGLAFNELLEVSERTVDAYNEVAKDYLLGTSVHLLNMRNFYSGMTIQRAREKLLEQFQLTDTELERRILFDPNVNALYRGMIQFLELELAIRTFPSRRQLILAAKQLARRMMVMNEAYSALAHEELQHAIRLTMHTSTNDDKYSFKLIPGPKSWTSPWHCALVLHSDDSIETIHRKDADALGYELVSLNGRPYYYAAK